MRQTSINSKRIVFQSLLVAGAIILSGCTKEKAEAIKNAAEQFRVSAVSALKEMRNLFRESLSMPSETDDKRVAGFANAFETTSSFQAAHLAELLKDPALDAGAIKRGNQEFDKLEAHYNQFAEMFRSLPEGSFLATKSVKKAEKHAINLTLELINFSNYLEKNPVQFTGRRVLLLESIQNDKKVADQQLRAALLEQDAKLAFQLQQDELQAKQHAIVSCLQAAESCRTVADLIRNYDKLSASDILAMTRDGLSLAAEISGGNLDVAALLEKYKGVETSIRSDPYWSAILDKTLNP